MKKNKNSFGLGVVLGAGLLVATHASAYNLKLGDWDVQVDVVSSVGLSVRTEDRDAVYLPAGNGGPQDKTVGLDAVFLASAASAAAGGPAIPGASSRLCGTLDNPSAFAQSLGSVCMYDNTFLSSAGSREIYNYDGSINTDDGRLNFDKGDLISGNAKLTADFEARNGAMTMFVRMTGFYDTVLGSNHSYERVGPQDFAENDISAKIDVLDAYLSFDFDIGDKPAMVRVGRQVINWGESTFFLGGNSVFSPIDVGTLRRPGAEIKEALLPVEALYGSVALSEAVTVEAYVGGWDNFKFDVGGTPFADSDSLRIGGGANKNGSLIGSGVYSGANRRLCGTVTAADTGLAFALGGASSAQAAAAWNANAKAANDVFGTCAPNDTISFNTQHTVGNIEFSRLNYGSTVQSGANAGFVLGDTNTVDRLADDEATDEASFGIALRWYAAELNSTEFGFYYQNYNSRIPYVNTVARAPIIGPSTRAPTDSSTLRVAPLLGCLGSLGQNLGAAATGGLTQAQAIGQLFVRPSQAATLRTIMTTDPSGVGAAHRANYAAGTQSRSDILTAAGANLYTVLGGGSGVAGNSGDALSGGFGAAGITALLGNAVDAALAMPDGSIAQNQMLGCISNYANAAVAYTASTQTATQLLPTGTPNYAMNYDLGFQLVYPEIDVYGVSFNTTLGGWGVQGELAYRPDMPLQLDTDALTIAALGAGCAWENFGVIAPVYASYQTIVTSCGDFGKSIQGYVEEDVWNLDIGTTATFTRSNGLINMLGADLGILLTEFGGVLADVDEYRTSANIGGNKRLLNKCTSGSYLPLGGVFSLDPRSVRDCQPTEFSSGALIMTQLQYNNFLGTPISIKPQLIVSWGLSGMSPTPAGSFIEGVQRRSLSITADYQTNLSVQLGYTDFKGPKLYTRDNDRDFASLSLTYAF